MQREQSNCYSNNSAPLLILLWEQPKPSQRELVFFYLAFGYGASLPMVGAKRGEDCNLLNIRLVPKLAGAVISIQSPID